jgi:hypothetical protein
MTTIEVLKRMLARIDARPQFEDNAKIITITEQDVAAMTDAIRQLQAVGKIMEFCNCRDVTPCYTKDAQIGFDTAKDMMLDRIRWAMEESEGEK